MTTVWNPSDKSSNFTLSNTDHTATLAAQTFDNHGVRSTGATHSTGKWYVEFTGIISGGGAGAYGFAVAGDTLGGGGQCRVTPSGGISGPAGSSSTGAAPDGHTLCIAIDLDNMRLWARNDGGNWNSSGSADPATNTGGLDITGITTPLFLYMWQQGFGTGGSTGRATVNAGDNAFVQSVPSGFVGWDAPVIITGTIATALTKASVSASAAEIFTGSVATALTRVSQLAGATQNIDGTIATALTGVSQVASGSPNVVSGTIATALTGISQAASASTFIPVTRTLIIDSGAGDIVVPEYVTTLTLEIFAPGGGGFGYDAIPWFPTHQPAPPFPYVTPHVGGAGGDTEVSTLAMIAHGGAGATGFRAKGRPTPNGGNYGDDTDYGAPGAGGTASGGDVNTTGEDGADSSLITAGDVNLYTGTGGGFTTLPLIQAQLGHGGGTTTGPVIGGYPSRQRDGTTSDAPGTGANGGGISSPYGGTAVKGAGQGGKSSRTWNVGDSDAPTPGDLLAYVIGAPGVGGGGVTVAGVDGAPGRIRLTWNSAPSESDSASDSGSDSASDSGSDSESDSEPPPEKPFRPGDWESIYSEGSRGALGVLHGNGLVTASSSLGSEFANIAEGIDGNPGGGPYYGGQTVTPGGTMVGFQFAEPQIVTGFRLLGTDDSGNPYGNWDFQGSTNGVTWIPLATGVRLNAIGVNHIEETFFNRTFYSLYRLTPSAGNTSVGPGRMFGEILFRIDHSPLDSGGGSKGVTISTSLRHSTGTIAGLIDGNFGSGAAVVHLASPLSESGESSDPGEFIRFHFPRPVAMRDAILQVFDLGSSSFNLGIWRWQFSGDGSSWTDFGEEMEIPAPDQSEAHFDPGVRNETALHNYWQLVSTRANVDSSFAVRQFRFNLFDPLLDESDSGSGSSSDLPSSSESGSSSDLPSSSESGSSSDSESGASSDMSSSESDASSSDGPPPNPPPIQLVVVITGV